MPGISNLGAEFPELVVETSQGKINTREVSRGVRSCRLRQNSAPAFVGPSLHLPCPFLMCLSISLHLQYYKDSWGVSKQEGEGVVGERAAAYL